MNVGRCLGLCGALATFLTLQLGAGAGESPARSPWLQFNGRPPPAGAVGVLVGSPRHNHFRVTWADGSSSEEVEANLVATPEPWMLPTLGPLAWPAVFDTNEGMALIAGRKGWGWTAIPDKDQTRLIWFEEQLLDISGRLEAEAKPTGDRSGYSFHDPNLIILEPQVLRQNPRDDAAPAGLAEGTPTSACESSEKLRPSLRITPQARPADIQPSPVRIVERRGDWAKVILPRKGIPWHSCFDKAVIAWDKKPAGWATLTKPGPVPGAKLRRWSIKAWGAWP